jgi:hypothetical protein
MTDAEKQEYLNRMVAEIGEHFDCVQILAHDSDTDSYTTFEAGAGSLFARQYQALRWSEGPCAETETVEDDEDDD